MPTQPSMRPMKGTEYLLELNREHSEHFKDHRNLRGQYRTLHPTEILALKCMDGRLNLPVMTQIEMGMISPLRNLGGKFDLGWPKLGDLLVQWVNYGISKGRPGLILVTYHYSRGDTHRGCRGFGYDTEGSQTYTRALKETFDGIYKGDGVYAIQVGIETDLDALILHGDDGSVIDLAELRAPQTNVSEQLFSMLEKLYPRFPKRVLLDFLPLVEGNLAHIAEVRTLNRPIVEVEHKESVLAFGRGFDWLHLPNKALIIGPFDPEFKVAIEKAATIILENIDGDRVKANDGIVLLASAPFYKEGSEQRLARETARYLHDAALSVINERVPKLMPYLERLVVTVDMDSRAFDLVDQQ